MTGMDLQRTREGRSGRECVRGRREKHTEGEGDIHTYTERGSGGAQAAEGLGEGVALGGSGGGAIGICGRWRWHIGRREGGDGAVIGR